MIDLTGKKALVTGASSGIGEATAIMLAQAGAHVAVHYFRGEERAQQVVQSIRENEGEASGYQADLTSENEIQRLVEQVRADFGEVPDLLFNNAGHMLERRSNQEMTADFYHKVMDLNVKSTVLMCQAILPGMLAKGSGKIVNMASVAAHHGGGTGSGVYAASKAAVMAYSKNLAKEAAPHVQVNTVSPGFIGQTRFHSTVTSEQGRQKTVQNTPLKREGKPDDVAGAVLYLASDLSDFLTGETIEINGGVFMR